MSRFQWLSISDLSRHNTSSYLIRVIWHRAWEEPSCYCTKGIHGQAYQNNAPCIIARNKSETLAHIHTEMSVSDGLRCISNRAARRSDLYLPRRTDLQRSTRNRMAREIDISANRAGCDAEQRHCHGGTDFQNVTWFNGTHVKGISFPL